MQKLKTLGIGAVLLTSASLVPVVPQDMTLMYSYQYHPSEVTERIAPPESVGSTSPLYEEDNTPSFPDEDKNDIVSVAVFTDRGGNIVYIQIPDATYSKMTKYNGASFNPTKKKYLNLLQLATPQAEAAIAFDASSSGTASATSLTVAHTVTGTDPTLIVTVLRDLDNTLTGVTYNGAALTKIGSTQSNGGNNMSTWYKLGPSTGTNNIVATKSSGSSGIKLAAGSYAGTDQSALDATGQGTSASSLTYNQSITTLTDNSWVVFTAGNNGGSAVQSNDAGTTLRVQQSQGGILDSNAAVTPSGSRTLYAKKPDDQPDAWGSTIISLKPSSGGGGGGSATLSEQIFLFDE